MWNRTASKAEGLVAKGAIAAPTIEAALAANELVVLSLTDYDAMYAILEPAASALSGRVVVNLSSDTPERAREAAKWLAGHGARQLTGGVQSPPSGIGSPEMSTFYSGPEEVFEAHRATLSVLTGTDYLGADPGAAALFYQLQMDIFWTSMVSFVHALSVAAAHGVSAERFLPHASATADSLSGFFAFYAGRIDAGTFAGDVDKLSMAVASIDHVMHTAKDAGIDASMPSVLLDLARRGVAAGHADDSFTSLYEVFKQPSAQSA